MHELAIKGGRVLLGNELVEANLYVRDGKISSISKRDMAAEEVVDRARRVEMLGRANDLASVPGPLEELTAATHRLADAIRQDMPALAKSA